MTAPACSDAPPPPQPSSLTWPDHTVTMSRPTKRSWFEVVMTIPPIADSFLASLPTRSLIQLYHISRCLRDFLAKYPLAWKTLSFRAPPAQPMLSFSHVDTDVLHQPLRYSNNYVPDALLIQVVVPLATRLTSLDLCNTAVSGMQLVSKVLEPRLRTLQHLSVRGCKDVSIKYHLLPFLEPYVDASKPWACRTAIALRSLYTFRCRHHRRRPYLPSSLARRDSDSEPTHQLIKICRQLGIWTDTTWCPTPATRCLRRREYYATRTHPPTHEIWVPFDRLWRSGNRIGPQDADAVSAPSDGRLWEDAECGYDGEPLGTGTGASNRGEGKHVPAHLRQSHCFFIDGITCDKCGDVVPERCEQCSIRMHCMGCRKTFCASCAFKRPLPQKKRTDGSHVDQTIASDMPLGIDGPLAAHPLGPADPYTPTESSADRFWWAPGVTRSPNLIRESDWDPDSSTSDDEAPFHNGHPMSAPPPPKLNMHWCCVEPLFSGGGGIVVLGHDSGGAGADRIRATPLPKGRHFEDPDFVSTGPSPDAIRTMKNDVLHEHLLGGQVDIVPYLQQHSLGLQDSTCPRSLCRDCYHTLRWSVACKACRKPLCREHDFRALKVRKCGFRNLRVERTHLRAHALPLQPSTDAHLDIPAYVPPEQRAKQPGAAVGMPGSAASPSDTHHQRVSHPQPTPFIIYDDELLDPSKSVQWLERVENLAVSPSSVRPRAHSASEGFSASLPQPWIKGMSYLAMQECSRDELSLPGTLYHPVKWQGCGAYICHQDRMTSTGDCRPPCSTKSRECDGCGVFVCDTCVGAQSPCECIHCFSRYKCPSCARKYRAPALCPNEVERKAKQEAERQAGGSGSDSLKPTNEVESLIGKFSNRNMLERSFDFTCKPPLVHERILFGESSAVAASFTNGMDKMVQISGSPADQPAVPSKGEEPGPANDAEVVVSQQMTTMKSNAERTEAAEPPGDQAAAEDTGDNGINADEDNSDGKTDAENDGTSSSLSLSMSSSSQMSSGPSHEVLVEAKVALSV